MSYLHQEQPVLISGRNRSPLPLGSGSVDITISDRSHRWLLIDKISIQVNSRLEDVQNGARFPQELIAALYEAKIQTKLTSLTDDFVPLLAMTQMQSVIAESEAFVDCASFVAEGIPTVPTPLNFIEWVLPVPLLLRPGEALKFTIRQNSVPAVGVTIPAMTEGYVPLGEAAGDPIAPVGAFFTVAAKGVLVNVDAPMTKSRAVPYITAKTFDSRNIQPTVATGGNAQKQQLSLENNTKRLLKLHSMRARWLDWDQTRTQGHIIMQQPDYLNANGPYLQPIVTITDYAGYDIVRNVPFFTVFPPQVAGVMKFEGAMQTRDVLKVTLSRDPRNGSASPQFFDAVQGIVALNGWRVEPF